MRKRNPLPILQQDTSGKSSRIQSVAWDAGILRLEFKRGKAYEYSGVPRTQAQELIDATSMGKYFDENIKGKTPWRKEGEDAWND